MGSLFYPTRDHSLARESWRTLFHRSNHVTILADNDTPGAKYRGLAAACAPRRLAVTLDCKVRGGLHTLTTATATATATYRGGGEGGAGEGLGA